MYFVIHIIYKLIECIYNWYSKILLYVLKQKRCWAD